MSNLQNLYNKYRPDSFSEFIGQDHVVSTIKYQLENNCLPHCLILYGSPGTGKTSLGRLIAKSLNPSEHGCLEKDSAEDGAKDRVKMIISDVYNKPFKGKYKTYIFDEAHVITRQSFSSLLKITEEPPEHVKFIFTTTEFEKIPNNIKSRSQCHGLTRISRDLIKQRLNFILKNEEVSLPDNLVNLAVQAADGSMRNGIVALENIITGFLSNVSEKEIEQSLGVIGSKRLTDFILSFLFKDFS